MFNVGGGEIIVILLVALIVLGPERLPGAGRQIGRALAELRRVSTRVQADIREAIDDAGAADLLETVSSVRSAVDIRSTVASTLGITVPSAASVLSSSLEPAGPLEESTALTVAPPDGIFPGDRVGASTGDAAVESPRATMADILSEPS